MIYKYIKYLLSANRRGYGIHSPFVYDLSIKVFKDKKKYQKNNKIEKIRKELLSSKKIISVTDFGAGSKRMKNNLRKIKKIVKHSASKKKYSELLFRLAKYFQVKTILELGTSVGIGTLYLSLANKDSKTYTIEGCSETYEVAKSNFQNFDTDIKAYNGRFKIVLKKLLPRINKPDLIFIDGNHRKEPTLDYFNTLLPYCHNNTVIIFDDISWSKGMNEAWETIKSHPKVTATIDLFKLGIVFFKKELTKQDFVIYY